MTNRRQKEQAGKPWSGFAVALVAVQLALTVFCGVYAAAEGNAWAPCSDGRTEVRGAVSNDFALICSAASDAMRFLQDCGLSSPDSLRLEVTKGPIKVGGFDVFGCFDDETGAIRLLDVAHCSRSAGANKAYAALANSDFYRSVVAHEVAHKVLRYNLGKRILPRVGHEYVAYAVQITLLPETVRRQFLAPIKRSPPSDLSRFADTLLLMAPEIFAAMSYDHFSAPENGCKLLRNLSIGTLNFPIPDESHWLE